MRYTLPAIFLALLLGLFFLGMGRDPTLVPSPLVGRPAPAFELPSLAEGPAISSESLVGQAFLLNVWGTWCPGCRQEHDFLLRLAGSMEMPIIGLNWKDDVNLAREWLSTLGDPYAAVAVDADGRVAIDWGVYGAPETFLVDAGGTVRYRHVGPLDERIWQTNFVPLIQELSP